jgi:hypothetical protein
MTMPFRRRTTVLRRGALGHSLGAPRNSSGAAERRDSVNAIAIMYVNSHLMELQGEAQRHRMASLVPNRSLRQRIGSAAASLRAIVGPDSGPMVPKLRNYPYEG